MNKLTKREVQILSELSKGATDAEIAGVLNISVETIKSHNKNIYKKLNVCNRSEAIVAWFNLFKS
ncbi:response regulator transcription factor [Sediminibacterium sp.]|uniref:response regulator transcription factor n=1 Tax=Sediminibacterium sp. TaxID=1917865 RepID=UPI003F70540F